MVTEVTVRLRPLPPGPPKTVVGFFDTLTAAGDAVAAVTRSGVIPVALELLDRYCLRAVEEWKRMDLDVDAAVLLLARVDTPGATGDEDAATVLRCFEAAGARGALRSDDEETAEAFFAARRLATRRWSGWGPSSPRTSACPGRG